MAEWYDNVDTRGYENMNYYDSALPYNKNLTNENMGQSLAGSVGHFDIRNRMMPQMLDRTGQMGASNYQAPPPPELNTLDPNWQHQLELQKRPAYQAPKKDGILQNINNWTMDKFPIITNLAKNVMTLGDATNPKSPNYNQALRGQIDYLKDEGMYGKNPTSGLNQITSGALQGKYLQSFAGSNDLIDMYNNQIAKFDKTISNLPDQWSRLKASDDPKDKAEYARKEKVFLKRRNDAIIERDAAIAAAKSADAPAKKIDAPVSQPSWHVGPDTPSKTYSGGAMLGSGMTTGQHAAFRKAEGGRIGYRDGEFVDEDVNIQGPGFDVNENIEMAEGPSPFEMRIDELMDEGLSWEEAYQIASQEFSRAEGEESFSPEGIASLV